MQKEAYHLDRLRSQGKPASPLAAIPYDVKNLFNVEGYTTLAGTELFATRPAAQQGAWAIQRLIQSDALVSARLNMDAYAYGFTTENSYYIACRNPWYLRPISAGSAAAVAAGIIHFSLGTDTNGSIRVPASLCGIFGLKPTFGRLSRRGSHPFGASLDHIGPLARRVSDLTLVYDALQGVDPKDRFQSARPAAPVFPRLGQFGKPLRVGVLGGFFVQWSDFQAKQAVQLAAKGLSAADEVILPEVELARSVAFLMTAREGGTLYLPALRAEAHRFDLNFRERLLAGSMLPASWYIQAQRFRHYLLSSY